MESKESVERRQVQEVMKAYQRYFHVIGELKEGVFLASGPYVGTLQQKESFMDALEHWCRTLQLPHDSFTITETAKKLWGQYPYDSIQDNHLNNVLILKVIFGANPKTFDAVHGLEESQVYYMYTVCDRIVGRGKHSVQYDESDNDADIAAKIRQVLQNVPSPLSITNRTSTLGQLPYNFAPDHFDASITVPIPLPPPRSIETFLTLEEAKAHLETIVKGYTDNGYKSLDLEGAAIQDCRTTAIIHEDKVTRLIILSETNFFACERHQSDGLTMDSRARKERLSRMYNQDEGFVGMPIF